MAAPTISAKSRLNLPARKCLAEHLSSASPISNDTTISNLNVWKLDSGVDFSIVWLQGRVLHISPETDSFSVDDGTGVVDVLGVSSIPAGCPKPTVGLYAMVIGELVQQKPRPRVKVMKLQNLSKDEATAKSMWKLEVQDLHNFVAACL